MIARGLVALTLLSSCVLSLPVTPGQLENEDVKVMKCIVEALADVLSRPRPLPVSQECLVTLRTDDRLVSILRHRNFLKVLQDIAVQGHQERAQQRRDGVTPERITQTPRAASDVADRSMLEALGGPGERSILSQKRRPIDGEEEEEEEEEEDGVAAGGSRDDGGVAEELEEEEKRENEEGPGSHASVDEPREEDEDDEEKSAASEEENMIKDKKGAGSGEKRHGARNKSKEKKSVEEEDEEEEEEEDKSSAHSSHSSKPEEEEEDEGEMKRGSKESHKRWSRRGKSLAMKKKAEVGKEAERGVPHHSKEVAEEEEDEKKKRHTQRSPEEKELQMIARGGPEERRRRGGEEEEEGSASRKSEEPEIESLAAIESELENVAQKLHEMRRG
ncbi:chromogranin-A [Clinocottus analis]|uniref:chromogranin-A n=1 Tax=Clinocottus analis TaxID=304258 RepID=UPI0035C24CE3